MSASAPRFAALGHQESWDKIEAIVAAMRPRDMAALSSADVRSIVPWIPPRTVSRFRLDEAPGRSGLDGIYVDTFISPDDLAGRPGQRLIGRVREAIDVAEREGADVLSLGGFTSILLESDALGITSRVPMTTGNSLTAALIVRGLERASALLGRPLERERLLIIGGTGDVGSACARWLGGRVAGLMLVARNAARLEAEADSLAAHGPVDWSTDVGSLIGRATMVVAAASTPHPEFDLANCRPGTIVCDAGYPANLTARSAPGVRRFRGGMGVIAGGLRSSDGILERFYRFPVVDAAHGCILEGGVLALAGRFESFSRGRGNITPDRIAEIWALAQAQGVSACPLFDDSGLWPEEAPI